MPARLANSKTRRFASWSLEKSVDAVSVDLDLQCRGLCQRFLNLVIAGGDRQMAAGHLDEMQAEIFVDDLQGRIERVSPQSIALDSQREAAIQGGIVRRHRRMLGLAAQPANPPATAPPAVPKKRRRETARSMMNSPKMGLSIGSRSRRPESLRCPARRDQYLC